MNFKTISLLGLLTCAAGVAPGFAHIGVSLRIGLPAPIVVREAPPRRLAETVVVSPGPGYVWVAGHYSWEDNRWQWIPGAWVNAPQPGAFWVEGRWDASSKAWTEGHWEIAQPASPPPPVVVTQPAGAEIIVHEAPPPLRIEHRGHRPGHGHVWISGYWVFRGGHYVWIPGRWELPPHGHRVWIEPRWETRAGAHVFIEGHWN